MTLIDVEAFAGPGGWSEGRRLAGATNPAVGFEIDAAACRTATAAGHTRVRADVSRIPLAPMAGKVDGAILSPPCPTFSSAGLGAGRALIGLLASAMTRTMRGENVVARTRRDAATILRPIAMKTMRKATRAERSAWVRKQAVMSVLSVEPARWVRDIRPRWVALEQVPAVLPLWKHFAALLREHGYSAWTGVLSAEQYGVPQTRKRAILIARCDGLPVGPPEPTHQPYRAGREHAVEPDLFGDPLPPPVSMAEALGWPLDWSVEYQRGAGMAERHGDRPHRPAPAPTIRAGSGVGTGLLVHMRNGNQANACTRSIDEPAGTPFFGQRTNAVDWVRMWPAGTKGSYGYSRDASAPSPTIKGSGTGGQYWTTSRPATTVCGDARIAPPGHRDREGGERQFGEDTVRVTVQEAAVLQSFRADYPWDGTKSQQYRCVGDAVPPLLAAAILRPLIQTDAGEAAA